MENNGLDYLDEVVALRAEDEPELSGQWAATKIVIDLRKIREDRGLTQAHIAARMGLSQPHVARLEKRPWAASFGRILAYAKAVGVDLVTQEETAPRAA